jgi:hypothetical protein
VKAAQKECCGYLRNLKVPCHFGASDPFIDSLVIVSSEANLQLLSRDRTSVATMKLFDFLPLEHAAITWRLPITLTVSGSPENVNSLSFNSLSLDLRLVSMYLK